MNSSIIFLHKNVVCFAVWPIKHKQHLPNTSGKCFEYVQHSDNNCHARPPFCLIELFKDWGHDTVWMQAANLILSSFELLLWRPPTSNPRALKGGLLECQLAFLSLWQQESLWQQGFMINICRRPSKYPRVLKFEGGAEDFTEDLLQLMYLKEIKLM